MDSEEWVTLLIFLMPPTVGLGIYVLRADEPDPIKVILGIATVSFLWFMWGKKRQKDKE